MVKPPSSDHRIEFADPARLILQALEFLLPPDRVSVDVYAARHRWLNNTGGGFVGKWQHSETPYLVEPMRALTSREYLSVVVPGPARSGKTSIAENWFLQSVGTDPAPMLWYMPSDPALQSYVKREINPMIDLHKEMKASLGKRPVDDSLGFKRFRGMTVEFLTAAYNNLISKGAARIILDEEDAYDPGLGDAYALADLRRQTFGRQSKILSVSHPDAATAMDPSGWKRGVMKRYALSDRRLWYWPCPHCNAVSSPHPLATRVMTLDYPTEAPLDEIADAARLLCPSCGALIEDSWRRAMNAEGRWIGEGQSIDDDGTVTGQLLRRDIAGFWIVGLMSPFIIGGIGALAAAYVGARRAAGTGDDDKPLRDVVVKRMGLCYEKDRPAGEITVATLVERAEPDLVPGTVPDGVRFITAFADVQGNRFEVMFRGWGPRGESWVIAVHSWSADPAASADDWDRLFARMEAMTFPLAANPAKAMKVRAWAYDSGGAPGVTQQAYDAWIRHKALRKIRLLGLFDGRHGWSVLPLKGRVGPNTPPLQTVMPDTQRKDRRVKGGAAVPQGQFNANWFKDALAGQLVVADGGAWSVHIPAALKSEKEPHIFFEGLLSEDRGKSGNWTHTRSVRNEPLDLMVGCHVVAHLHGLAKLNWAKPPAWAGPHDTNTMIAEAAPVSTDAAAPPPPAALPTEAATAADRAARLRRLAERLSR